MTVAGPPSAPGSTLSYSPVTADYTLTEFDLGLTLQVNSASAVTITLPNNLPVGFACGIEHLGAGTVTFAADSGATLTALGDATMTAGTGSVCKVQVSSNSNNVSAVWVLTGDTSLTTALIPLGITVDDEGITTVTSPINGGSVYLVGADGEAVAAGSVQLYGGSSDTDAGGDVYIFAGAGDTPGVIEFSGGGGGGLASIHGGQSDVSSQGDGGHLHLYGGQAWGGSNTGGDVVITRGGAGGGAAKGNVIIADCPTVDPAVAGALWNDAGTIKISAGV